MGSWTANSSSQKTCSMWVKGNNLVPKLCLFRIICFKQIWVFWNFCEIPCIVGWKSISFRSFISRYFHWGKIFLPHNRRLKIVLNSTRDCQWNNIFLHKTIQQQRFIIRKQVDRLNMVNFSRNKSNDFYLCRKSNEDEREKQTKTFLANPPSTDENKNKETMRNLH